jgi:hypothetical protein
MSTPPAPKPITGLKFNHDGTWKTPNRIWITDGALSSTGTGGIWRQVRRVYLRNEDGWSTGPALVPGTPIANIQGSGFSGMPIIAVSPAPSGGPVSSYTVRIYDYDSAGTVGSKTLRSTVTTAVAQSADAVTALDLSYYTAGDNKKTSIEVTANNALASSSAAVIKWQTGTAAYSTTTAIYGWVASGYERPTTNYFMVPSISLDAYTGHPKSNAYDDSTTSTYISDAVGKTEVVSWGLVGEIRGSGVAYGSTTPNSYRPTITLNWGIGGNASTRRLSGLKVIHYGLVGTYSAAYATFARGTMVWRLENSVDYSSTTSFETQATGNVSASTMSLQPGTTEWTSLTQPWGSSLTLRAHRPAFQVVFGDALSRFQIADIRVNVENYQITGYSTTNYPATAGSTW